MLTLVAQMVRMIAQFPLVSEIINGMEYMLKYTLQVYGEVDFEEGDIFEHADDTPMSKFSMTKSKKRSGNCGKESTSKTALRPETDSIALD